MAPLMSVFWPAYLPKPGFGRRAMACVSALVGFGALLGTAPATAQTTASVTVNAATTTATIPATAFGMHNSVYDNNFNDASVPTLLGNAGVTLMRYPGGGYADQYHWSNYTGTQYQNSGSLPYLAPGDEMGHFAK